MENRNFYSLKLSSGPLSPTHSLVSVGSQVQPILIIHLPLLSLVTYTALSFLLLSYRGVLWLVIRSKNKLSDPFSNNGSPYCFGYILSPKGVR